MFIGWSPTKFMFLWIKSIQKKQEAQRCQKGCVHIYGYKLFIVHLFFMRILQVLLMDHKTFFAILFLKVCRRISFIFYGSQHTERG